MKKHWLIMSLVVSVLQLLSPAVLAAESKVTPAFPSVEPSRSTPTDSSSSSTVLSSVNGSKLVPIDTTNL